MTSPDVLAEEQQDPVVPTYTALCLVAVGVMFLVLLQRGFGSWSLLPPLLGCLGLILRWRVAPLLLLLALAGLLFVEGPLRHGVRVGVLSGTHFPIADFVLCGAVLAYVGACYRLQSLELYIFPPDPRRRERTSRKASEVPRPASRPFHRRRSTQVASPWEIGRLLLALPLWATLAQLGWWSLLQLPWEAFDLPRWVVHGLVVTWILAVALFVSAGVLNYLSLRRMRPLEAQLFLQDTLWYETRREQRRLNRWTAWARLRAARAKEMP